jgi:hypothetical protein
VSLYAWSDFSSISHIAGQPGVTSVPFPILQYSQTYSSGLAETMNTMKKCELNRKQEITKYNLVTGINWGI